MENRKLKTINLTMRASFQVSCSPWPNYKRKHKSAYFTVKTGSTQAQAQAQASLCLRYVGFHLTIMSYACTYACPCACVASENQA